MGFNVMIIGIHGMILGRCPLVLSNVAGKIKQAMVEYQRLVNMVSFSPSVRLGFVTNKHI